MGEVDEACDAWVAIGSQVYTCELRADYAHDHANHEVGVRWAAPRVQGRTHGLRSTYLEGCRCDDCTSAARPKRRRQHHDRQRQTADAPGRGKHWTGAELEIAARADLTTLEVARMLGRTFSGVKGMRAKLLRDPRKHDSAGVDRT